jgi:hypothetical protein
MKKHIVNLSDIPLNSEYINLYLNEDGVTYTLEGLSKWGNSPYTITPAQGRMMLLQMGLLSTVKASIEYSTDEALIIFWEYSLSWDRDNIHIAAMAGMLGMTEEQTDQFFIQAKKI